MRAMLITAVVVLAAGCPGKAKDKPKEQGAATATAKVAGATDGGIAADAGAVAASSTPDAGATPAVPPPVKLDGAAKADVEAFVARWLAAQNAGDFAAYQGFYGDRFQGVRRSGKVVKRFDRAGWMKDRGKMFKHPMTVESAGLVAYQQGDRRQVFFTQTWSQGRYKDVGTKTMVITGTGDAIRLAYEELLESKLQKPTPVAAPITDTVFGYDRAPSVPEMRLARVSGGRVWLAVISREVAWVDPEVEDDITDAASGQIGAAVVEGGLPDGDPFTSIDGMSVNVLDANLGSACAGTLGRPVLRFAGFVDGPDDQDDLIEKARTSHDLYLVAPLKAPCTGAYVAGHETVGFEPPDTTELPERALKSLRTWDDGTEEGAWESAAAGKAGWVLVNLHTKESCESQEAYEWSLHRATQSGRTWSLEKVDDGGGEDTLLKIVDVDGDGALDVITERGGYVGGQWQTWEPDLRLFWPAGLGCDGYSGDEDEETIGD